MAMIFNLEQQNQLDIQSVQNYLEDPNQIPKRKILSQCSPETKTILQIQKPFLSLLNPLKKNFKTLSLIPAAGAASRYKTLPHPHQMTSFEKLHSQKNLLIHQFPFSHFAQLPKAFLPYWNHSSFLDAILDQQKRLSFASETLFIVPQEFLKFAQTQWPHVSFDVQPSELFTPRLKSSGELYPDKEHFAPGGHGCLLPFCAASRHPEVDGIHIRNLDNTFQSQNALTQLDLLEQIFYQLKAFLEEARICCQGDPSPLLKEQTQTLQNLFGLSFSCWQDLTQRLFFLLQPPTQDLLNRPLVLLAAVQSHPEDQGGGFVIASGKNSEEEPYQRLSLERGHVANPQPFSFFNPALVFLEPFSKEIMEKIWTQSSDWLIVQRPYKGQMTFYKERLLYEMISQSAYLNTVVVEVSRDLFRPNKTLSQTLSYEN